MDITLSKTLNSPIESYKGTSREPKVKMGKSFCKIKAKGVKEISEHEKASVKAPCIGNSQNTCYDFYISVH